MDRVKGKIAVVTGVADLKGVGYAIAKKLGREGAILAITDISNEVYERAGEIKALGYSASPFKVDLIKFEDVNQMIRKVLDNFGRIDILVNVAEIAPRGEERNARAKRFIPETKI